MKYVLIYLIRALVRGGGAGGGKPKILNRSHMDI